MIIGGISQYLTTVQGMPKDIEDEIISILREFLWNGKPASVSLEKMQLPPDKGGLGILDIISRNEAIELMWTKQFLAIGEERPTWAYTADDLIRRNLPKTGEKYDTRLIENQNMFLQTWAPAMHSGSKLPKDILKFLKIAKKYNVNMKRLRDILMRPRHVQTLECMCRFCEKDRTEGCDTPHKCCKEADKALTRLEDKYNPFNKPPIDNLSLTK